MSSRLTPRSVSGPLAGLVGEYESWLVARGCCEASVYVSTCALARLSWWMGCQGLGAGGLSHEVLDAYVASERERGGTPGAVGSTPRIRAFLADAGLVPVRVRVSRLNTGPVPALLSGPLAGLAPGFAAWLTGMGYKPGPARARGLVLVRLSRWMDERGVGLAGLGQASLAGFFASEAVLGRSSSGDGEHLVREFLAREGLVEESADGPEAAGAALLEGFKGYLLGERGLAQATAAGYAALVAPLADWLCAEGPDGRWDSLDARAVAGFVEERGTGWSPGSRGVLASAVRSLLGWARGRGLVAADLTGVVFSHAAPAGRLPARAGAADVGAMLGATPGDSSVGLRDRAVITVLHRLALRSGELARLGLDDVDWAAGRLRVVGKGRELTLPIPVDVGEALEAYLTVGRPKGALDRSVFTMARAPLRGLTVSAVNGITRAAGRRAGVGPVSPRQLRHGAATAVVNQGGSLAEAGQLLGHARPATTAIYARLDLPALRPLAREWGV